MDRTEILEMLVCDFGQRPAGAPTTADILPAVLGIHQHDAALVIEFEDAAAERVAAFVAAEQRCCSTIGWELTSQPAVRLRLTGTPSQLEALTLMFSPHTDVNA